MKSSTLYDAWILDAQIHKEGIKLWLKLPSGDIVAGIRPFHPYFYAAFPFSVFPSSEQKYQEKAVQIRAHPDVYQVEMCDRRIRAEEIAPSLCLKIVVQSPFKFKKTIEKIRKLNIFELFNADLPLVQIFFYSTGLFPFGKVKVGFKKKNSQIYISFIQLNDSNEVIDYDLPPLRIIWLEIQSKSHNFVTSTSDPLHSIVLTIDPDSSHIDLSLRFSRDMISQDEHGAQQIIIQESSEYETLEFLQVAIKRIDPDVIFTHKGDETIFPYLLSRCSFLGLINSFTLSRDSTPLKSTRFKMNGADSYFSYGQIIHRSKNQFYLNGRLHINSSIMGSLHFDDGNIYGIVEIARISYIALQRLTRITIGGALQSIQFYHAFKQGILIPEEKKNAEIFRKGWNLLLSDRGGHILNPQIGMFDRVAELDFTSMYPSLMVFYNVSPETLNCPCCKQDGISVPGLSYYTCKNRTGVVPLSLRLPLTKRMHYKKLAISSHGRIKKKYDQMQTALKWILVVCFGYLGFRNARFGRIEAHQAVCAYAREFILNGTEIVEKHGIHYLHGIVDSLYVQSPKSMNIEIFHMKCQKIAQEITQKTNIPISYDSTKDYFQFILFLPTKADPLIGALNRYWGIKPSGKAKVRGLELRRHDSPVLIKNFQEELMRVIGSSIHRHNFDHLIKQTIIPVFKKYIAYLESGTANTDDLAVNIRLTRRPEQYSVMNYQAIAAKHLQMAGLPLGAGQKISFIIVNDSAPNKMDRVLPVQIYRERGKKYDIKKYKELLLRAFVNMVPFVLSNERKMQLLQCNLPIIGQNLPKQLSIKNYL